MRRGSNANGYLPCSEFHVEPSLEKGFENSKIFNSNYYMTAAAVGVHALYCITAFINFKTACSRETTSKPACLLSQMT